MSLPSRSAAIIAAATALVVLGAPPSWPGNRIDDSGKTFKVIVPIDVFADDPGLDKKWTKAITEYWNDGPGLGKWKYCGRRVEFVPDIIVFPRGAKGRPDTHDIYVKLVAPGVDFTSNVRRKGGKFDPAGNSTGVWASNEDNATIAHEFGHFLGLGDEYEVSSQNPRRTRPRSGFEGSLMAEHDGGINQSLIDKAMMNNKAPCEVWEVTWHEEHGPAPVVTSGDGKGTATVAPDGEVSGQGKGTFVGTGGSVRYSISFSGTRTQDAFLLTVDASGSGGGEVEVVAPIKGKTAKGKWNLGIPTAYNRGTISLVCVTCE